MYILHTTDAMYCPTVVESARVRALALDEEQKA